MTKKKQINFVVISLLFTNALSAPTKDGKQFFAIALGGFI